MKVIALKDGFFNRYITTGEEFDVPDDLEASWFSPLNEKSLEKTKAPPKTGRSKHTVKGEEAA